MVKNKLLLNMSTFPHSNQSHKTKPNTKIYSQIAYARTVQFTHTLFKPHYHETIYLSVICLKKSIPFDIMFKQSDGDKKMFKVL